MTTAVDYNDHDAWPKAMLIAEQMVEDQIENYGEQESYISVTESASGWGYRVGYSTSEKDVKMLKGHMRLERFEYYDYLIWKRAVIQHRQDSKWAQVIEALRAAGFYPTDSVGLKMALKIWEIVNQSDAAMSALQILHFEISLENHLNINSTEVLWKNRIVELPALYGEGLDMNRTARRALKNLVDAGLLETVGKTKGMSYRIPGRDY